MRCEPWQSGHTKVEGSPSARRCSMGSPFPRKISLSWTTRASAGAVLAGSPASRRSSIPIEARVTTWSTSKHRIALEGIDGVSASAGSWTTVVPPARAIALSPAVPSSNPPVSSTPMTPAPREIAADLNNGSIAGRVGFSFAARPDAIAVFRVGSRQ